MGTSGWKVYGRSEPDTGYGLMVIIHTLYVQKYVPTNGSLCVTL